MVLVDSRSTSLEVWLIPVQPEGQARDEESTSEAFPQRQEWYGIKSLLQKHFLKTIWGPNSSYSSWLIQAALKAGRLASTAPPLHTEKSRSLGLVTRTLSARSGGTISLSSR